ALPCSMPTATVCSPARKSKASDASNAAIPTRTAASNWPSSVSHRAGRASAVGADLAPCVGSRFALEDPSKGRTAKDAKDAKVEPSLLGCTVQHRGRVGASAEQAPLYRKPFRVLCVFRGSQCSRSWKCSIAPDVVAGDQLDPEPARIGCALGAPGVPSERPHR